MPTFAFSGRTRGGETITDDLSECPIDTPEAIAGADHYASIIYKPEYAVPEATIGEQGFGEMMKAGKVGFDWNDPMAVLSKIREECDEIEAEIASGDAGKAASEVGDLLFAVVNLARHLDADPEAALRACNQKFTRRFAAIERALAGQGRKPENATLAEMDALWDAAKAAAGLRSIRTAPLRIAVAVAAAESGAGPRYPLTIPRRGGPSWFIFFMRAKYGGVSGRSASTAATKSSLVLCCSIGLKRFSWPMVVKGSLPMPAPHSDPAP